MSIDFKKLSPPKHSTSRPSWLEELSDLADWVEPYVTLDIQEPLLLRSQLEANQPPSTELFTWHIRRLDCIVDHRIPVPQVDSFDSNLTV